MGSGGHNRRKDNISQYKHINIRFLQQKNCLKQPCSFIYSLDTDREIICSFDGYSLNIFYSMNKGNYIIGIDKTRNNYGYRTWFICPLCRRRTTALYYRWNYYRCRTCQRLNYYSSQRSHNQMEQVYQKIYKIQDKLKAEHDPLIDYSILKPKRMHYKTYIKLMDRLEELDEQCNSGFKSEGERKINI